jgi:hypothetical protein
VTTLPDSGNRPDTAFGHFSGGLSQFRGHGSWLVCAEALSSPRLALGEGKEEEGGIFVSKTSLSLHSSLAATTQHPLRATASERERERERERADR